jgi:hypothetical protein
MDGEMDIWDRCAPLAGLSFVAAFIISAIFYFASGSPAHDTPSSVQSYVLAHRHGLEASWWFLLVGGIAELIYIMGITAEFRRRLGTWSVGLLTLLSAGVIAVAGTLIECYLVFTVLYSTATKTSADITYALGTLANTYISDMETLAVGVTVIAAGSLIFTTGAFRRWLAWVAVIGGALMILGSTVGVAVDAVSFAGSLAGGILSLVFVAGTSVSMLGAGRTAAARITAGAAP